MVNFLFWPWKLHFGAEFSILTLKTVHFDEFSILTLGTTLWCQYFHFDPENNETGLISIYKGSIDPRFENPRENHAATLYMNTWERMLFVVFF